MDQTLWHLTKEDIQMANEHIKISFTYVTRKMQIKTKCHRTLIRMAKIWNTDNTKHWQRWRGGGIPLRWLIGDRLVRHAGQHLPAFVNKWSPSGSETPQLQTSPRETGGKPRGAGHHVHCPHTDGSRALERPREAPYLSQGEGVRNVTDACCGIPCSIPMQWINVPASTQTDIKNGFDPWFGKIPHAEGN